MYSTYMKTNIIIKIFCNLGKEKMFVMHRTCKIN